MVCISTRRVRAHALKALVFQSITRPWHGLTDYNYIAVVSAAPKEFGFEDEPKAVLMTRVLTGTILVSSVFTRAEWGFVRVMPYKAHLALDFLGGMLALSVP